MHLQVLRQQIPQGPCSYELGYAEQFKFNGNVSNNGLDLEKVNVKLCIIADVLMIISSSFSQSMMLIIFFYRDTHLTFKET